ncbi:hypothetical protein PSQ40_09240 [Curvibacter sp. HBC61]|uniref:Uncharacterized protein n=1 Tax=Curvibacter cyanobacteriorum TaxID=3026422 RepID=A0ABT5MXJ9_9BURK|nr:hypothetical protein [Curvibacter sp. HBC61]MDD0838752.1 hypothetical protein [Curvibacter sp. HBC61]
MSYLEYLLQPQDYTEEDLARIEALRHEAYDDYRARPIEEVWEMADFSLCFRDDAPVEIIERFKIRKDIARELTRYYEWRNQRPAPTLPIPEDAGWVWGRADPETYAAVEARYPGILRYFASSNSAPRQTLWDWISRYDQWAALERDLMRLLACGEQVADWIDYEANVREHLERVHLGVAQGDFA